MDGFDRGNKYRVMGTGFSNVAHIKKCNNKDSLDIYDLFFSRVFQVGTYQFMISGQDVVVGKQG